MKQFSRYYLMRCNGIPLHLRDIHVLSSIWHVYRHKMCWSRHWFVTTSCHPFPKWSEEKRTSANTQNKNERKKMKNWLLYFSDIDYLLPWVLALLQHDTLNERCHRHSIAHLSIAFWISATSQHSWNSEEKNVRFTCDAYFQKWDAIFAHPCVICFVLSMVLFKSATKIYNFYVSYWSNWNLKTQ